MAAWECVDSVLQDFAWQRDMRTTGVLVVADDELLATVDAMNDVPDYYAQDIVVAIEHRLITRGILQDMAAHPVTCEIVDEELNFRMY